MKKNVFIACFLGILTAFGLFLLREGAFVRAVATGYFHFQNAAYAMAERAFSFDRIPVSDTLERQYFSLSHAASLTETNSGTEAIPMLSDLSFSGNPRMEALRLYDLWNAYVGDARGHTGAVLRMSLESALAAYSGSLEIRWDADTEHNYQEVANYLREDLMQPPPDEETGTPQNEGTGGTSEKTGSGKSSSGSETSESQTGALQPNSGNWTNGGNPAPLKSSPPSPSSSPDGNSMSDGSSIENGAVGGLSPAERDELKSHLEGIRDLQREQQKYVRPDGTPDNLSGIPGSFKDFFQGDPFFEKFFGSESGGAAKNW